MTNTLQYIKCIRNDFYYKIKMNSNAIFEKIISNALLK